jgi:hypothetical protein
MENTNIGGWRAFFERFEQFFLNKFYEYTTTKDGMEIWVLYQFYTPLLGVWGSAHRPLNLWPRPSGPWPKL